MNLQCGSIEELDNSLVSLKASGGGGRPAVLSLYGPQTLVRHFDLPLLSPREIGNALKLEAAEVFSLLPEEIEIDYQILESLNGKTRGVFIGIPKETLTGYVSSLDKASIVVEKITVSTLERINLFLQENKIKNECFYVIDFLKEGITNLVVFDKGSCVLLREIHYENLNDAEKEIIYSLKYSVSKSAYKKFDAAYALGDLLNKDSLISGLEKELQADIIKYNFSADAQLNIDAPGPFFDLNLVRKYFFSKQAQRRILYTTNATLIICLLLFLGLSLKAINQHMLIKNLSASYNAKDYKYAKGLQERLNLLKNAK